VGNRDDVALDDVCYNIEEDSVLSVSCFAVVASPNGRLIWPAMQLVHAAPLMSSFPRDSSIPNT